MKTTIESSKQSLPTLSPLFDGNTLKVYNVSGEAGMIMPWHFSTREAVITVKSGLANLKFENSEHTLNSGTSFLIEAGQIHALSLLEDFQATVVMPIESEIKFAQAPHVQG